MILAGSGGAGLGRDPSPAGPRQRKYAMIPRQVGAGFGYQCGESCDEVFRLEDRVLGAIAIVQGSVKYPRNND